MYSSLIGSFAVANGHNNGTPEMDQFLTQGNQVSVLLVPRHEIPKDTTTKNPAAGRKLRTVIRAAASSVTATETNSSDSGSSDSGRHRLITFAHLNDTNVSAPPGFSTITMINFCPIENGNMINMRVRINAISNATAAAKDQQSTTARVREALIGATLELNIGKEDVLRKSGKFNVKGGSLGVVMGNSNIVIQ